MSEIIDVKDALERVQDDRELLLELFDIFQEDFLGKRNAFWQALENKNATTFHQLAHGMKGATGNISAKQMHENCIELDDLAKKGDFTKAKSQLELLDKQYSEFQAEALRLKKEFGK